MIPPTIRAPNIGISKPRASGDDPEAGGGVHFTEA